ncbi:NADH dehydrogenase [ubiquinone] 1 beta subcomplex subunit 8, mitochondrial [Centropristis striata]|uniref:NADH dehydrogenase [ubiquinone] 1 beta subcomplex subunit 8, mitochondrial n=1 Tax=Centropristis striata TaxID=184440 RepID=UPI0027E1460D|nr:NADH dehydrogenase [ubiquinone] 1 beta subcomplex subunit 8, mitochondrial [Centropristis striata]
MAVVSFGRLAQALCKRKVFGISAHLSGYRAASGGSKDHLPGPFPMTPEERAAAAKKFNMRVEDYEPIPDEGDGFGDYPKLPNKSQHERDPWYEWDHPDLRRNWGEPMHWDFDMYIRNNVDTSPTPTDYKTRRNIFCTMVGVLFVFLCLGEMYPNYQPIGKKQLPYNNLYLERGGDPEKEPEEVKNYKI